MIEINEWNERYEVTDKNREAKPGDNLRTGPLRYIRLRVHGYHQGTGMRKLKMLAEDAAMEVFGIFAKLLEVSGDSRHENRGKLLNEDGNPATAKDLAFILDITDRQMEYALKILTDEKLGWITETNSTQTDTKTYTYTQDVLPLPETPGNSRETPLSQTCPDDITTYQRKQDIPPEQPNEEVAQVMEAWLAKIGKGWHNCPKPLRELAQTQAEIHVPSRGLAWCLAAVASQPGPHLGVMFVNHSKTTDIPKTAAELRTEADLAELARRKKVNSA
jgi:hypothetical protein